MKFAITLKQLFLIVLVLFGAAQFVPVERTNPPTRSRVPAPEPVAELLRRACFDCHSHETQWPWYAKVAPVSWLIGRDVNQGREHLNFSAWNQVGLGEQQRLMAKIWEEVKEKDMPPPFYVLGHPEARVTTDDHRLLRTWIGIPDNSQ